MSSGDEATAELFDDMAAATVFNVGDNVYEARTSTESLPTASYGLTLGAPPRRTSSTL